MGEKTTILTMPPKRSRSLHGQIRHLQDNRRYFSRKESDFVHKARNIQYREQQAKDAGLTEHEMIQKHGDDFKKDKPLINKFSPFNTYPKGVTQMRTHGMDWGEKWEYSRNLDKKLQKNHEAKIKSLQDEVKAIESIKQMYKTGEIKKLKNDQQSMIRSTRQMLNKSKEK